MNFGFVMSSMVIVQGPLEFETLLVHLIIENYFTAVDVLISNSVYRYRGVLIAAFEFSSHNVSFMRQLLNQHFKRFDLSTFQWKVHHQVLLLCNANY